MARHKDAVWTLDDKSPGFPGAQLGVLMDLRDELKEIKSSQMLQCNVALAIRAMAEDIRKMRIAMDRKRRRRQKKV